MTGVRAFLATYRRSTLVLFLVTGVGFALALILSWELEPSSRLISWLPVFVPGVTPIGLPFIAGWLSPRLSHVALLPVIVLVSTCVAYLVYVLDTGDTDLVPALIPPVILAGLASVSFTVGWGARRVVRKAEYRLRT